MKMMKKALSLILCLSLMAVMLIPATAASITPGQAQAVLVVDDETPVVFQFVPDQTGYYTFYSYDSQDCDPYGYIMDANNELLTDGDDTENGLDFSISCHMIAGKTYYLAATCYSGSAQYTVQIQALAAPTSIAFEHDTYTGSVLDFVYPQILFAPQDCAQEQITLSSSNTDVVRIGDAGDFYFGIPGTATVTAVSESGLTATCTVTVEVPDALTMNTPWTLDASKGEQCLSFMAPNDGWYGIHSEGDEIDPYVEVLNDTLDGIIQDDETLPDDNFFAPFYLKAGQRCYFSFRVNNANTGTAQVTLQKLSAATAVTLPESGITAYTDTFCWLIPVFEPRISIPEELTWSSSNEDVVYVDQLGHASFLQSGNAVITVTSETGKSHSATVTVLSVPENADLIDWGICGTNLQWQLNSSGTLTVTGSGEMYKLYNNDSHWNDHSQQIRQVILPDGITTIGYGAFLSCTELTEIEIPDSVRSIDSNAFGHCYALTRVALPEKLETLGTGVFDYCTALEQVNLPQGLKRLPNSTFRCCFSLSQITLPQSLISIGDNAFSGCPIKTVSLPQNLKTIGFGAFAGTMLTELTLPEGLTELRDYALLNCQLEALTLPATVTVLGNGFATGTNLHTIRFLGSAPSFDPYALDSLTLTAYYPAANRSWTEAVRQNYNGSITWVSEGKPGVDLRGAAAEGTILTLTVGTEVLETVTAQNGSYALANLQPGAYTLTATAVNCVPRTYTLTVADQHLTQDILLHLIGDIDGNGKVNIGDVAKINAHIKGTSSITDEYALECANVNGGKLNMGDAATLYSHIRGTKKLY